MSKALALGRTAAASGQTTTVTAQALLAFVTGRGRAWLLAHPEAPLTAEEATRYEALLERAVDGEPLAHLIGEREFCGLAFAITPDVLVPRQETESLVEEAVRWIEQHPTPSPRIVDVGTGSGAIAVSLAVKLPAAHIMGVEISGEALAVARWNVERHAPRRVGLVQGDLLAALAGPFDVIVANLPYINREELGALEVGRWEPRVALDGGTDGLDLVRRLLRQAPARLARPGLLVLEIGADQGQRAAALGRDAFPVASVGVLPDLAGLDRIVRVDVP